MPEQRQVMPFVPPPVEAPGPREQAELERLRRRWGSLFAERLEALGVEGTEWWPVENENDTEADWMWEAEWQHGGVRWHWLLENGAAEALLAAQLGQEALTRHEWTELDLRLLRAAIRPLAEAVGWAWEQGGTIGAVHVRRAGHFEEARRLLGQMRLARGQHSGQLALAVRWPELRAHWQAQQTHQARLEAAAVEGAPIHIEALVTVSGLSVQELLEMAPGDVVILGRGDAKMLVQANGQLVAYGRLGAKSGQLAISVEEVGPVAF